MSEFLNVTRTDGQPALQGDELVARMNAEAQAAGPTVDTLRASYDKQPVTLRVVSRMPAKGARRQSICFVQGDTVGTFKPMSFAGTGFEDSPFNALQGLFGATMSEADGVPAQETYSLEQLKYLQESGYEIVVCEPQYRTKTQG